MKENKVCFLKELNRSTNIFFSAVVGTVLALVLFVLDKFSVPGLILKRFDIASRFQPMVITLLYGALLSVIALVVLILLVKAFSKKIVKEDALLVSYDFFSVTLLVSVLTGLNEAEYKNGFVIAFAVIAVVLTLIRVLSVKETGEEVEQNTKNYRIAAAKRFNLPLVLSLATLVGVGLGISIYYIDFDALLGQVLPWWLEQSKFEKIGYVAGIGASVGIGFNLYTIFGNKNIKFGWLDGFLIFATVVSFFAGLFLAVDINRPAWHFHAWAGITLIFAVSVIVRSLYIDAKVESRNLGKVGYYFGKVAEKFSALSLVVVGFVVGGLIINADYNGMANLFVGTNTVYTIIGLASIVAILAISAVSLFKDGLKADRAIALDYTLLLALVIGGVMLFDLYYAPTIVKLIIWLFAYTFVLVFVILRVCLMKVEEVPAVEEVSEPVVEETTVKESVVEDSPVEEVVEEVVAENTTRKTINHYYINKLKFTKSKTKLFYTDIKNLLLSYGVKSTVARRNETFRKSGVVCKVSVSGKTLRVHLPLDPNDEVTYNINKYHQFNLGSKKRYADVPFTMKVRSGVACRRVLELLEKICLDKGLKLKKGYESYEFYKDLDVDGRAIFDKAGCLDMLVDKCDISYAEKFDGEENPSLEKICSYIPSLENYNDGLDHENGEEAVVTIDKVVNTLGEQVICLETLKNANLVSEDASRLVLRVNDSLSKPVAVVCDEIDEQSALVVLATGGKIAYYENTGEYIEDVEADDDDNEEGTEVVGAEEETLKIKAKRTTFINKVKFTSEKTKQFYSLVKNKLLSYGAKNRLTRRNEAFRKSGLLAKISVSGKTLRLHLPLNPLDEEKYPLTKYHQINLGDKKQYSEVPFTLKIKSDRALNRALALIDEICVSKEFKLKRKYEEVDFAKDLVIDGPAIFEKLGCVEKLVDSYDEEYLEAFKEENAEAYSNMVNLIPSVSKVEPNEGETQNVYIDTVLAKLEGDEISLATLKDANIISKSTNKICVKIHDELSKKITVVCDEITPDAALAVLATGGKVVLTK